MKIPDGWTNYKAIGNIIEGTRFIAFKVPLKEGCVKRNLPPKEWFTPQSLISELKDDGKELGLVIDLTNTTKYYNKSEFICQSVEYEKIFTKGHVVPSNSVCERFNQVVDRFLHSNQESESLIGVHCTHGLNRTGYIVCRYMIDCLKIEPDVAIEAFNIARGHPIERENYLGALRQKTDRLSSRNTDSDDEIITACDRIPGENDNRNKNNNESWHEYSDNSDYRKYQSTSRRGASHQGSGPSHYQRNSQENCCFRNTNYNSGFSYFRPYPMYSDRQYIDAGWTSNNRGGVGGSRPSYFYNPYNNSRTPNSESSSRYKNRPQWSFRR